MVVILPLLLGLFSWGFGIFGLFQKRPRSGFLCSGLSLVCCCGSLYCCLYSIDHWVQIEDISAILDCTGAYRFCAGILLFFTVLCNVLIFARNTAKT